MSKFQYLESKVWSEVSGIPFANEEIRFFSEFKYEEIISFERKVLSVVESVGI